MGAVQSSSTPKLMKHPKLIKLLQTFTLMIEHECNKKLSDFDFLFIWIQLYERFYNVFFSVLA